MTNIKIRSKILIIFLITSVIILSLGCSNSSSEKELVKIPVDVNNITKIIEDLASEKFKGRLTGTEENLLAADYISEYFGHIELTMPEEIKEYKQWYTQKSRLINSAPKLAIVDKEGKEKITFKYVEDFVVQTSPMQRLEGEIISQLVLIEGIDSLKRDIMDKTILIEYDIFNELINSESFMTTLMGSNLKGIIIAMNTSDRDYFGITPYVLEKGNYTNKDVPFVLNVNMRVYEELVQAMQNEIGVKISANFSVEEVKVPNIVGVIEGTSGENIVIGAHLDHAGDNMNGTYNPGALDNASGTATIMEVARILKSYNKQPKKTIIFIAFNGEEQLAYGSKYYVSNPLYPLENTKMINVDTVGSKEDLALQIEGYDDENTEIVQNFANIAKSIGVKYSVGTSSGTDHSSFGEKKVQVVNLIHPDFKNGYHSPGDTIHNIDVEKIEKVIKLIVNYLDEYAY